MPCSCLRLYSFLKMPFISCSFTLSSSNIPRYLYPSSHTSLTVVLLLWSSLLSSSLAWDSSSFFFNLPVTVMQLDTEIGQYLRQHIPEVSPGRTRESEIDSTLSQELTFSECWESQGRPTDWRSTGKARSKIMSVLWWLCNFKFLSSKLAEVVIMSTTIIYEFLFIKSILLMSYAMSPFFSLELHIALILMYIIPLSA